MNWRVAGGVSLSIDLCQGFVSVKLPAEVICRAGPAKHVHIVQKGAESALTSIIAG